MKKIILISCLLLLISSSYSQPNVVDVEAKYPATPGSELIKASNNHFLGTALIFTGIGLFTLVSASSLSKENVTMFQGLGVASTVIGVGFSINSWLKIRKAGIMMNEKEKKLTLNINPVGFKLAYKL